jgi:hypothetical protein
MATKKGDNTNWADLKALAQEAYEKTRAKKGAFDILQRKRTGVVDLKKETGAMTAMFDEEELSDIESFDFSSQGFPSGRGRQSTQRMKSQRISKMGSGQVQLNEHELKMK